MKKCVPFLKRTFCLLTHPVLLAFVHGACLTALFVLLYQANYEDGLYQQIIDKVTTPEMSRQDRALKFVNVTHQLLNPRRDFFTDQKYFSFHDQHIRSGDAQLIDAKGDCGSYSHVLARMLDEDGFPVRMAQMQGEGRTVHIFVETEIDGRWIVMDSLFDLVFRNPDQSLATFQEVSSNWQSYSNQVPDYYDHILKFEGVRYTNWKKIPVVMPLAKTVLGIFMGERVEWLSLRSYMLNLYRTLAVLLGVFYAGVLLITIAALKLRPRFLEEIAPGSPEPSKA